MEKDYCTQEAEQLRECIKIYIAHNGEFENNSIENILEQLHQFDLTKNRTIGTYDAFKSGSSVMFSEIMRRWELLIEADGINDKPNGKHVFGINTILHTKDGAKIGNAIVIGVENKELKGRTASVWEIKTDYGNIVHFTDAEVEEFFKIAWSNCTNEKDGYTCDEMQKIQQKEHKYAVKTT